MKLEDESVKQKTIIHLFSKNNTTFVNSTPLNEKKKKNDFTKVYCGCAVRVFGLSFGEFPNRENGGVMS